LVNVALILLAFAGVGLALSKCADNDVLQAIIEPADLDEVMVDRRSWQPSTISDLEIWLGADWLYRMTLQTVTFQAGGPAVDDERLHLIAGLKSLESLTLKEARITDTSLSELAALPRLRSVELSGTPLTDMSLSQLAHLSGLNCIILSRTKVTEGGVAKLRTALPDCRIEGPEYVAPSPLSGTCGVADDWLRQTTSSTKHASARTTLATH
jgi:hypothetical protein